MRRWPKRFFVLTLFISLLAFGCSREEEKGSLTSAPEFSLTGLDGENISSRDFKGKVVFLHFWATWCRYCVNEIPDLNQLYSEYEKQGVAFLAVSLDQDGPAAVRALNNKIKMDYPIAMGNARIAADFGNIRGLPSTFIITPQWRIYRHIRGYVPKSVLEQTLQAVLKKG